ncbi:kinase-like domain-containing protein, partial [Gigaspora rosea]
TLKSLEQIHKHGLVHSDLHSGNVLLGFNGVKGSIKIGDLGLCQDVDPNFKNNNSYGILPYTAPEVLENFIQTTASDIYSFGMLMWEFTTGYQPFSNKAHNDKLILEILKGERPKITEDTPSIFANL